MEGLSSQGSRLSSSHGWVYSAGQFGTLSSPFVELQQRFHSLGATVGRQAHQLAALVPVAEDVGRSPAVHGSEPGHVVEFVAQETALGPIQTFFSGSSFEPLKV